MRFLKLSGLMLLLSFALSCSRDQSSQQLSTPELQARREQIEATAKNASPEAVARKQRSDSLLAKESVPVNQYLPVIEAEANSKRRTTEEVAIRAMALCVVATKADGMDQKQVDELIERFQLASAFTPDESAFIKDLNPNDHDRSQFVWRYECYSVLLWSLGYIDKLERPDKACDLETAIKILNGGSRDDFIKKAKLRPQQEILDAADLIYRYHWAVVDAQVKGQDAPAKLSGDVVVERHYVLNWLIGYMDQEWDDVTTDT
jgi:hypothetical protein